MPALGQATGHGQPLQLSGSPASAWFTKSVIVYLRRKNAGERWSQGKEPSGALGSETEGPVFSSFAGTLGPGSMLRGTARWHHHYWSHSDVPGPLSRAQETCPGSSSFLVSFNSAKALVDETSIIFKNYTLLKVIFFHEDSLSHQIRASISLYFNSSLFPWQFPQQACASFPPGELSPLSRHKESFPGRHIGSSNLIDNKTKSQI